MSDAIERSILAQHIIPYFKANISLFRSGDRLTQISIYINLLFIVYCLFAKLYKSNKKKNLIT